MNRRYTSKKLAIALALATIPFLVGCGSSSSTGVIVGPSTSIASTNGIATLLAGPIPAGMPALNSGQSFASQTYGTVSVNSSCIPLGSQITFTGAGNVVTGLSYSSQTFISNGMNYGPYTPGDISVTATTGGTIYGTLVLSQYEMGEIQTYAMQYLGTSSPCISGIALAGNLDTTPTAPGFEGYVALYLNGTGHGWITESFTGVN